MYIRSFSGIRLTNVNRTKVAIKMSRVSDKHKDTLVEEEESIDSDMSEDDEDTEDAEREETPDLYRNSSLGMCVSVHQSSFTSINFCGH